MRRIATLLAAAAVVAVGLGTVPASAYDGRHQSAWHNGGHERAWRASDWRGRDWRHHEWRAHRWYPRYHGYFGR
jgi:hypothetical protein